jgi:hypothetical protein
LCERWKDFEDKKNAFIKEIEEKKQKLVEEFDNVMGGFEGSKKNFPVIHIKENL